MSTIARCTKCGGNSLYCKCPMKVADLAAGDGVRVACGKASVVERVDIDCGSLPLTPSIPQATAQPAIKEAAAYVAPGSLPYDTLFKIADERLELLLGCRRAHRGYQAVCEQQIAEKNAEIEGLRKLIGQCVDYVEAVALDLELEVDYEYSHTEAQKSIGNQIHEAREFSKLLRSIAPKAISTTQAPEAAPNVPAS